jgi:hypothetical protein
MKSIEIGCHGQTKEADFLQHCCFIATTTSNIKQSGD